MSLSFIVIAAAAFNLLGNSCLLQEARPAKVHNARRLGGEPTEQWVLWCARGCAPLEGRADEWVALAPPLGEQA